MTATSLEATFKFPISALQRLLPVAAGSWVHGAWHEAVIGLPGIAAASMTGIEGAAVIQLGRPQAPFQIAVECQLLEGLTHTVDPFRPSTVHPQPHRSAKRWQGATA